jgi:serine protease AprX
VENVRESSSVPVFLRGLLLALLLSVSWSGAASATVRADRDHDKVFDSLDLDGVAPRPVLVALREPATASAVREVEQDVGALSHVTRLRLVDAFSARATPAQIRALARRSDVDHVEDDAVAIPFGVAGQASFGVTRASEDLPDVDGRGLVAAVIDSGIDPTMADLAGAKVVGFKDFVNDRTVPYDDLGHGSLVSGLLAGSGASGPEGRGVAPGASLVSVKVIDSKAQSNLGLIAQGIQWAVENRATYGIDAINLSIGDPVGCGDGKDVASQAVDAAVAAGIVVVTAAGNSGPAGCTIKSPAAAESAITVGAMADTGAGGFSEGWFSSRGPTADERIKPDVSAPGVNVVMVSPTGTIVGSGTSAAAPFVTGTALLMLQAKPTLKPAEIKDLMERTAIDWGAPGRDNDYGYGRLDAYAALEAAGAPLATPPAVPSHQARSGSLVTGDSATFDVEVADARFPLAVTLNAPSVGFGLALRDSSGTDVGTTTTQPVPSRQRDISLLAPVAGHYTVTVSAPAAAGAFALDVSGSLVPTDTTAPALTVDTLATGSVGGTAGGDLGDFPGVVVRVRHAGDVVRRIGTVPILGRWSADFAVPDGDYTVDAEQGDAAGNVTRTPARALTVDTVAPAAPVVNATVHGSAVAFSGTAEAGATIEVREGGDLRAKAAVGDDGAWSRELPGVADGAHAYAVSAVDAAGNASAAVIRSVSVDTQGPVVTITGGPDAFAFQSSEPGAALACRLDGGAWGACATAYAGLPPGPHLLEVRATDLAGNVGPVARSEWTVPAPQPAPSVTPTPTAVATPPVSQAPALSLTVSRQRLPTVLKRGLSVLVTCTGTCRATLVLMQGKKVIARRTVSGTVRTTLTLSAASRRALARTRRVSLTLVASAPGAVSVSRRVSLTR